MALQNRSPAALSLEAVLRFLDCSVDSHCFNEGVRIISADHLTLIGVKDRSGDNAEIVALCVQKSGLTGTTTRFPQDNLPI